MGRVFVGVTPGGRKVAVKLVRPEYADDEEFRRRFAREVEAARKVGGFHTAQVVDADPGADPPWMALAYIPGPSLAGAVADTGPLDPAGVRALGAALAEGLGAIHARGLVHRDLKPGNVILAADGPRIVDFGLAYDEAMAAITVPGTVMGTPAYMSPEQHGGLRVTPAADVFSLGAVLVFAATGHGPFDGESASEIRNQVLNAQPSLAGLSGGLRAVLGRCLAKRPADRPALAGLLASLAGQPAVVAGEGGGAGSRGAGWAGGNARTKPGDWQGPTVTVGPRVTFTPDDRPLEGIPAEAKVDEIAFSPDGRHLVAVTWRLQQGTRAEQGTSAEQGTRAEYSVIRWEVATGRWSTAWSRPAASLPGNLPGGQLAISPDGRFTAQCLGREVLVRDTAAGKTLRQRFSAPSGPPPASGAGTVPFRPAFSADGSRLAMATGTYVHVWDTVTLHRAVRPLRHPAPVREVRFSPDGRFIATVSHGVPRAAIRVWDVSGARPQDWEAGECDGADAPAPWFSPDGGLLAVIGELRGKAPGSRLALLWDVPARKALGAGQVIGEPRSFSPDGELLATIDRGSVRFWELASLPGPGVVMRESPAVLAGQAGRIEAAAFSPDWQLMGATATRVGKPPVIRLWRSRPAG